MVGTAQGRLCPPYIAPRRGTVGWAKAPDAVRQRAHHSTSHLDQDGGHGARAPLPTLHRSPQGDRRVGKGAGRSPATCPPFNIAFGSRWWARRKGAFAHPTSLPAGGP